MLPADVELRQTWIAAGPFPLHPDEEAAIAQAVAKRRAEFAAGRHCARQALLAIGIEASALPVGRDRVPAWPANTAGSITHDEAWCAAAVASSERWAGLGIDIELIARFDGTLETAVATPAERARWLQGHDPLGRQRNLARLFSAKEACFKAHFPLTGTFLDFTDAELTELPATPSGAFRLRLLRAAAHLPVGYVFQGGTAWDDERVCAAVCLAPGELP